MGHKGDKGTEASVTGGGAEGTGLLKKILDLTSVLKYLLGGRKEGARLCSGQDSVGTRETTQNFIWTQICTFFLWGIRHWSRWPRDATDFLSMEMFKLCLLCALPSAPCWFFKVICLLSKDVRLAESVTSNCGCETCSAGNQGSSNMLSRCRSVATIHPATVGNSQ